MPANEALILAMSAMLFIIPLVPKESRDLRTIINLIVATVLLYEGLRGHH